MTPIRLAVGSLVVVRWWSVFESRPLFRGLFLALPVAAFVASCGDDAGDAIGEVGPLDATVAPATTDPAQPVVPRHGGPVLVNRGDNYVYGDLSWSGDCLRISYLDQVNTYRTRDGLLLVWPVGFDVQLSGDAVEVVGADGSVVAADGQTLRVSGRRVRDELAAVDEWDWDGGDVGHCSGPYWLVGDEVTAILPGGSDVASDDGIFFPRIAHQRGPIVSTLEGMQGRLVLRGRCLLLEVPWPPGEYLVVWPPGFGVRDIGGDLFVLNGGGNVIVRVGEEVTLGGNSGREGATYSGECPGAYFKAYSVTMPSNSR